MSLPKLPLQVATSVEPITDWSYFNTPQDLILWIARMLSVDPNQTAIFQEIYTGTIEPSGEDRGKLWIKIDPPYAVMVFNGSSYQPIYNYPPNVPLLWTRNPDEFPSYLSRLTEVELSDFNLENPEGFFYFMLKA